MEPNQYLNKKVTIKQKQYQIQRYIGEGSHATIWGVKAMFYPQDEVIVKVAKAATGITQERVQNEIWFLKEIVHPHIPQLLDHGYLDKCLWLAMPVFEQLNLTFSYKGKLVKVLVSDTRSDGYPKKADKIPIEHREKMAVAVLSDIGKVIAYIAGSGIIHADISPGNIMEKRGSFITKQYVLTDWGAASLIHRYPEEAFGSLNFTAPERLKGQVGSKSDLFSLGVVVFYILTGKVPYPGAFGEEYYLSAVGRDGACPSDYVTGLSSGLDKVIRDLIRFQPQDRPEPDEVCRRIEKLRG